MVNIDKTINTYFYGSERGEILDLLERIKPTYGKMEDFDYEGALRDWDSIIKYIKDFELEKAAENHYKAKIKDLEDSLQQMKDYNTELEIKHKAYINGYKDAILEFKDRY